MRPDPGVARNERLTAVTGAALFLLLAAIGPTVPGIGRLLPAHLFLGLLLVPPLLVKLATTGFRFASYYLGAPAYRAAGPPSLIPRLVAPIVVATTVVLFGSGIELWLFGVRFGAVWIDVHKLSFILWFFAMGVHVLTYIRRSAAAVREERDAPDGALQRRSLLVGSLLLGLVLAVATVLLPYPLAGEGPG